ncbi:MAG: hypothetical protein ACE5EL_08945 [Anaerolineae bacterium]
MSSIERQRPATQAIALATALAVIALGAVSCSRPTPQAAPQSFPPGPVITAEPEVDTGYPPHYLPTRALPEGYVAPDEGVSPPGEGVTSTLPITAPEGAADTAGNDSSGEAGDSGDSGEEGTSSGG